MITDRYNPLNSSHQADCLVALHAVRSSKAVERFRQKHPLRPIVLCLSGTDIHADFVGDRGVQNQTAAQQSLETANFIILIEPECKKILPVRLHAKTQLIYQSATPVTNKPSPLKGLFEVTVLAHLRDEKDPFRTALAARKLPSASKIQIKHIGSAYTSKFAMMAEKESRTNSRYQWIGERSHLAAQRLLARSRLTVLTSRIEGAPSVFAEAIMNDVPILATRIDASIGMLGRDYAGLFEVGDTRELTDLLHRVETDRQFYEQLKIGIQYLKPRFQPQAERATWQEFVARLFRTKNG